MPEVIRCPDCGNRYPYNAKLAGQSVLCAACGGAINVPAAPQPKPASNATKIRCGGCGASYRNNPQLAGKQIPCPACGQAIQVPEAEPQLVPLEDSVATTAPALETAAATPTQAGLTPIPAGQKTNPAGGASSKSPSPGTAPRLNDSDDDELTLAPIDDLDKPKTAPKKLSPVASAGSSLQPIDDDGGIPLAPPEPVLATADFFDQELQVPATLPEDDAAPVAPPGKKKKKKRRRKRQSLRDDYARHGTFINRTMVPIIGTVGFGLGGITAALSSNFFAGLQVAFAIYHLSALLGVMVGYFWGLVYAVQDDPIQGLLYMTIPFYCLVYNFKHREYQPHPYQLMFYSLGYWGAMVVFNLILFAIFFFVVQTFGPSV